MIPQSNQTPDPFEGLRQEQASIQEGGELDPSKPYRLAQWLNHQVIQYCSTSDYTVGRHERDDIAVDIVSEANLGHDALHHWRTIYGAGVQGEWI